MTIVGSLINLLFVLYILLFFARSFLPLVGVTSYHPVGAWIYRLTEPLLRPIRARMSPTGAVDWSPTIAVIILIILRMIVLDLLF